MAQDAQEYVRLLDERSTLSERLKRITEAQGQIAAASTKKAGIVAPSDAEMRRLRDLLKRETDLRRQLELARVSATFVPSEDLELTVLVGEKPGELACPIGFHDFSRWHTEPEFCHQRSGSLRCERPGNATTPQIEQDLEQERLALSALTRQFDTTDPEILEARRQANAQLNSEIQQAGRALSELLAGQTEEAIRKCDAELADRADQIKTAYPAWGESIPDAPALTEPCKSIFGERPLGAEQRGERGAGRSASADGRRN